MDLGIKKPCKANEDRVIRTMIEIKYVKVKNFLSFGNQLQEVYFERGINLVTGTDKDRERSNGAGKSSMLETIQYALFGQTTRGLKKDQIVNWKNRAGCLVELGFSKNGIEYKILRGDKPNIFDIYKNDTLVPKQSHIKYYQQYLEGVLGLNFQTFTSLLHTNINSAKPILEMSKYEKRAFIEKTFGLEKYSNLVMICNAKLKKISEIIKEIQLETKNNDSRIDDANKRIANLENRIKEEKSKINSIKEELNLIEEKIKNTSKSGENDEKIKSKIKELEEEKSKNDDKIVLVRLKISQVKASEKKSTRNIERELEDIEKSIDRLNSTILSLESEITKLDKNLCPTCGQKLVNKKVYNEIKKKNTKEQTKLKSEVEELKVQKEAKIKQIEKEKEYEHNKQIRDEKVIEKLNLCLKKLENKNKNIVNEIESIRKEISNLTVLVNKKENFIEKIKSKEKLVVEFTEMTQHDKMLVDNLNDKNKTRKKEVERYTDIKDHILFIKDICSDEKIKSYVISSIIPYLTDRVNYYLSKTNFGFFTRFDNFLEMEIKGPGILYATYKNLSGGERRGIDLALQFAFFDILKKKAKIFPDILVLDEILDSSIDASSTSKLMDIISAKQKEDKLKVFIISHRPDMLEDIDVNAVYNVVKTNGYSKITKNVEI